MPSSDLVVDGVYPGGRAGNASDDPLGDLVGVSNSGGFRYLGSLEKLRGRFERESLTPKGMAAVGPNTNISRPTLAWPVRRFSLWRSYRKKRTAGGGMSLSPDAHRRDVRASTPSRRAAAICDNPSFSIISRNSSGVRCPRAIVCADRQKRSIMPWESMKQNSPHGFCCGGGAFGVKRERSRWHFIESRYSYGYSVT